MDDNNIRPMYDSDIESILKELELLDDIKAGHVHCKFCGKTITLENLNGVFQSGNEKCVTCDSFECIKKLGAFIEESRM